MNKTAALNNNITRIDLINSVTVNIEQLCFILNCGRSTAMKIAEKAEARICENRRVLYNVKKIKKYIDLTSI